MDVYKITFFGHRDFHAHQKVEEKLFLLLHSLIRTKPYVEIYVGRNGEFDTFVASVVKRVQKSFGNDNSGMTLVLPYPDKDISYYEHYYDSIIIPDCVRNTHPQNAIIKRNRWMVEECDLFICYVERKNGGAFSAFKHATRCGKIIINLAVDDDLEDHSHYR